ncbi:MAG TPA: DUF4139 domain-containing protein [Thermodesulfobacteriota bacterium]|nr:DUF4139 domain-containing protein [Thermodesulfobacteriota bacterium]
MKTNSLLMAVFLFVLPLRLPAFPVWAIEKRTSTLADQTTLELTVYNSNLGLVKDLRQLPLPRGPQELRFMDVAAQIIPTSVRIQSSKNPEQLQVLEQNYEYDLLNPRKLLDKYVGKEVKLYTRNYYTEKEEIVTATVLANNEGTPVYQIGRDITYGHPGRVLFPEIPQDLISKPTLVWLLDHKTADPVPLEVLYLTQGINWRADYVLVLNETDTQADLSGWVTIDNKSGATYQNARLKLVAGDIHRVQEEIRRDRKMAAPLAAAKDAPQFKEDSFFEYHLYTLDRKTTVKDNQTKQISLLDAQFIPVKKEFIYRGFSHYFRNKIGEIITNQKVAVFVEFQKRKENHLGMPIPKGTLRVYKQDHEKSLQLVGEDTVDHTPKDEKIRVKMGEAFDLTAVRKQLNWEKIASDNYEASFEISLRNHKKEDVVIKVVEPLPGDWKVLEHSHPFTKMDSGTLAFEVPVARDKEANLIYRVRLKF